MMTPEFPREMPNYSHGTAGICDFLLSLDARLIKKSETQTVTNYDGRFANAAVAGANYLTSIAEDGSCQILHHKNLAPDAANEDPLFYLGWCHGPAGTGRLFLNLSERFPLQKEWRHFAEQGGEFLMSSGIPNAQLPGFWNNVGVCCGSSGVGSYVLELYKATGNPKLKEFAIRLAMDTVERGKKHELSGNVLGLSWTHAEHRVRPEFVHAQTGVMQGAAGIGLWFLKLHATLNDQDFDLGMPLHPLD